MSMYSRLWFVHEQKSEVLVLLTTKTMKYKEIYWKKTHNNSIGPYEVACVSYVYLFLMLLRRHSKDKQ